MQKSFGVPLLKRLCPKLHEQEATMNEEALYEDIRNNLEHLLNTRKKLLSVPKQLREIRSASGFYGMEDFTYEEAGSAEKQTMICQHIEQLIAHFEPRISHIKVSIVPHEMNINRVLKLRIEAQLNTYHHAKTVFESRLDIRDQTFRFE